MILSRVCLSKIEETLHFSFLTFIYIKMLKFRTPETKEPLFEAVYRVERFNAKISAVEVLYPIETKIDEKMSKIVISCAFPLENNACTYKDKLITVHVVENHGNPRQYLYIKYFFQSQKIVVIAILSEFLHIRLFEKMFTFVTDSNIVDVLSVFSNPEFKYESYEVTCESDHPDYVITDGISMRSEIANFHLFFLTYYPPAYAATIVAMLVSNIRVFVVGSSTAKITQTIFAIISFFYPVVDPVKVISLIRNENEVSMVSGSSIIGVHTTMLTKVSKLLMKEDLIFNIDDPYITCEAPPKFSTGVLMKIHEFQHNIKTLTKIMKPAFPAKLILRQTTGFLLSLIGVTYSINPRDVESVKTKTQKFQGNGANLEYTLAKSMFMKEFIEKSESKEKEFELFFEVPCNDIGFIKKLGISVGSTVLKTEIPHKKSKTFLGIFSK
jgi:hypothetical protein